MKPISCLDENSDVHFLENNGGGSWSKLKTLRVEASFFFFFTSLLIIQLQVYDCILDHLCTAGGGWLVRRRRRHRFLVHPGDK